MIIDPSKDCKVIFQRQDDEPELMGEPAIVVSNYTDCICLESEAGHINVNRSTIPELIKVLREYQKNMPK